MWSVLCYGKKNGAFNYCEFICDSESDLPDLPTNEKSIKINSSYISNCAIGSKAIITDVRKLYVLNNQNEWVFLFDYNCSGGGSLPEDLQIATVEEVKKYLGII